ncbi:erythroblast NAD(P)(+)--arginine ADP-ribosyltransferase-like [Larimichthys crocea]|uniref:erythroblast NAD(P)(+)--arginine ADP-ribosyltransferase-like n=1 Tax=Larimichthys crocea TaxID=215358 RepID=UPI000F5D654C|nr:erythroblast NAD(P)(+)--arginine ADP-ribosyltransferase-like [Larimichthys crocea]
MKGNVMIFASLYLLLCWMMPVDSMAIRFNFTFRDPSQSIPLSMVEDAVDDMYFGCNEKMAKIVIDNYFEKELTSEIFGKAWKQAKDCTNRSLERKRKEDVALTKDHMQAICLYTSDYEKFYKKFNEAVRTNRTDYGTSFPFQSLHFWLTSAIQILNNNKKCTTTYRRTNDIFNSNDKIIRFGFFASSSYSTDLKQFGNKTCFKIKTCFGAFLKDYPHLGSKEQEVLIPPYEKFKITKATNRFVEGLTDCEIIYNLESAGVESNLDCRAAK